MRRERVGRAPAVAEVDVDGSETLLPRRRLWRSRREGGGSAEAALVVVIVVEEERDGASGVATVADAPREDEARRVERRSAVVGTAMLGWEGAGVVELRDVSGARSGLVPPVADLGAAEERRDRVVAAVGTDMLTEGTGGIGIGVFLGSGGEVEGAAELDLRLETIALGVEGPAGASGTVMVVVDLAVPGTTI